MRTTLNSILSLGLLFQTGLLIADPDPWQESYRLENAYQYDAALNALNGVSSDNELVNLRRGWLYYLKGSNSKSIDHYKKAIKKNSKSLDARLGIILPLMAQQRWREAESNAKKVLEVAPWNYHAHVRLMATEQALKQWSQLEKHARSVYERYPSDADALVFMARAYRKQGNDKAATQAYEKVLELAPDNFEARQYTK
ncbi:MAG: tetratricopeptide repeat protein [Gammaproteobacteria bacterium]|jgi:tetratricopeptide (TPR) repeat protein